MIDVAIVTVSTNQARDVAACLEAIFSEPPRVSHLVYVVDNGSHDETPQVISRWPPARYIHHPGNWGFSRNNNFVIAQTEARYVLVLNPDTRVQPGAIDELVRQMDQHPEVGIGGARLLNPDGSVQYSTRTFSTIPILLIRGLHLDRALWRTRWMRDYMMWDWDHQTSRTVDMVTGACMIVRREAIREVGGLDERYTLYFEDQDWCYRMWKAGWEVRYFPSALVYHQFQRASAKRWTSRAARIHIQSMGTFLIKHYGTPRGFLELLRGPSAARLRRQATAARAK